MLNCPLGLIAGTAGNATLENCENGILSWSSSSGDLDVQPQPGGNAILTAAIGASGVATVSVTCDIDGTVESFDCPVNLIPPTQELVCEISPPLPVVFETCGQECDCETFTLSFNCEEFNICDTSIVTIVVKDCAGPPVEPCPTSTPLLLKADKDG